MTANTFRDQPEYYAEARPLYPAELFEWIASLNLSHHRAWDSATGNGQAAIGLSRHYRFVEATDLSPEQIHHAMHAGNITYSASSAEATPFPDRYFDVITVAQALHWFDFSRFWPEVRRVAATNAVFVAWGYDWLYSTPELNNQLIAPFRELLSDFWAPNNRILWDGYNNVDVHCPFTRVPTPSFTIRLTWTPSQVLAYMKTWSAYKRSRACQEATQKIQLLLRSSAQMLASEKAEIVEMPLKLLACAVQ